MSRISSPAPLSERASPYQGLTPFTPEDTPYFFGREQDTEIITANLIAERLTLLYGPSGVGKSSVLGAGVVHNLRERAQRESARGDPPEYLVVFFNDWRNEPVAALVQEIEKQLRAFAPPPPAETTLAAALRAWSAQTGAELLFIFDQFEEYFLYHENDKGDETFAAQFANVLKDADGRANFLLSFREDALAKMDFFKKRIPNLFKNYLRIKHLDDDAARRAILKPLEKYNADHPAAPPVTMEPALVEEILREVQVGNVVLGETGRGALTQEVRTTAIETPFLQLVLTRLWTYERERDSHVLRLASFTALGGAEKIVRGHLQNAIDALSPPQQAIAASIFDRLVTPSGAKIAQTAQDLARYAKVSDETLNAVLVKLSRGDNRILRPVPGPIEHPDVPRYEIFHDILSDSILEWRAKYEKEQEQRELQMELARKRAEKERETLIKTQQARTKQLQIALLIAGVVLLTIGALTIYIFQLRQEAISQASIARNEAGIAKVQASNAQRVADTILTVVPANAAQAAQTQAAVAQTQAAYSGNAAKVLGTALAQETSANNATRVSAQATVRAAVALAATDEAVQSTSIAGVNAAETRSAARQTAEAASTVAAGITCMPNLYQVYLINDWHDSEKALAFIENTRPPFIKVFESSIDEEKIREAKKRSPSTLFIGRIYFDDQRLERDTVFNYDPVADAHQAFEKMKPIIDKMRGLVDIWEGYNEIPIDSWNNPPTDRDRQKARNYSAFTVEMARLMHAEGVKYAAFSFSNLNPVHHELWDLLLDGVRASDYIALHGYYPIDYDIRQFMLMQDWAHLETMTCDHARAIFERLPADARKPFLITE